MRRCALIFVAGALGAGVGCGEDDDPITPITPTESTASAVTGAEEFIASGDAVCSEANAAIANLSSGTSTSSLAAGQELEIIQDLLDALQGLDAPDDSSGALDDYYAALEQQISLLGDQESAVTSGDAAAADALTTELDAAKSQALSAAGDYGFDVCGEAGTALPSDTTPSVPPAPVDPGSVPVSPPAEPAPVPAEPVAPAEPAPVPVEPPPPTGGTGTGGGSTGGTGGGSSGGISPG